MSLREIASADLLEIMNDDDTGGDECTITSPAGVSVPFKTLSSDIHQSIDPGTGEIITGRQVSAAVLTCALIAAGFSDARGISDSTSKPWRMGMNDVLGRSYDFKIVETHPDNTIGATVFLLEAYEP